jgi:hypothetical protein
MFGCLVEGVIAMGPEQFFLGKPASWRIVTLVVV